ncbi:MAG: hypothetical protein CUN56_07030 [Phototrophicales bacterium]|nr:MAG: hypothetical protein CUN56_07030 [Phototrophicales bacterium]
MKKIIILMVCSLLLASVANAQTEDTYVVQPGDTLQSIAAKYNTSWEAIAARNGIINPNTIYRGQLLYIPRPGSNINATVRTYTVKPGDTLRDIALRYNTTVEGLVQANNITSNSIIYPGQVLTLPATGGAVIAPAVSSTQSTSVIYRTVVNGYYRVQYGDTLSAIARSFNVDMWSIARANYILNLNAIYVGQLLRIPGY